MASPWTNPLPRGGAPTGNTPGAPAGFGALEASYGLPQGLLHGVWGAETSYGRDLSTSSAGAMGQFQFLPSTGAEYGLNKREDFFDLGKSSAAAAHYLSDLARQFGGDITKAIAAYNWGPGNVQRDVAQHGDRWKDFLPAETAAYLVKVLRDLQQQMRRNQQQPTQPNVRIDNRTGGSVVITARSAALAI